MKHSDPPVIRLEAYKPPDFHIDHVDLDITLDPAATEVASRLTVRRAGPGSGPLMLHAEAMEITRVTLDGKALSPGNGDENAGDAGYEFDGSMLSIPLPAGDGKDATPFTLETQVRIAPAENSRLEGLYQSNGIFCTQCEAEGFRRITPFLDRPDVLSRYRVTLRADAGTCPVLLCNGNPVEAGPLPDGWHYAVFEDPFPKPCYLFALVAGRLDPVQDRFTTRSGRAVALRIYVEPGNGPRASYAMDALKRAMAWDEARFGLEYDLDIFNIVAVSDFNMGAMENKSLNIFNAKYILADPQTATDGDYANIEAVVAHEYFHNWTGNRVTCRDWFQLSLKEGLTVFRDQEFSADMRSRAVKRIQDVRLLRARQFPEDAGPLAHPVRPDSYIEINNFYTATVYEKGAEVIRMLQTLLGRDGFARGMECYIARHDGQAVTCDDFLAAMEAANDVDLGRFTRWYAQAGTPRVRAQGHYDKDSGHYHLTLSQKTDPTPGQRRKSPLPIPLKTAWMDSQGQDMRFRCDGGPTTSETVLLLEKATQRFTFAFEGAAAEAPMLSINRDFSAPVILSAPGGHRAQAFSMGHDSDPFARWEAGFSYATDMILGMIDTADTGEEQAEGAAAMMPDPYVDGFARTMGDDGLDHAFRAQVMALPTENYLAERMAVVDVEGIHHARRRLRRLLAERLQGRFLDGIAAARLRESFRPTPEQAGRRAFANACLGYLAATGDGAHVVRVAQHFTDADNMTDRLAALTILADLDCPERERALAEFAAGREADDQVMDKWFAVQATSCLPETPARVRALMKHPGFSLRKPNKVRALIGSFVGGNPLHFHAADGSGYALLLGTVRELDPINPQIAARLLGALGQWRRHDAGRKEHMCSALDSILSQKNLSPDCFEIASKALAG